MPVYIKSLWLTFTVLIKYISMYFFQWIYFYRHKKIRKIFQPFKIKLEKKDIHRITDYSIRLYAIFSNYIKIITTHSATSSERYQMTLLGAFTPLFDDFVDDCQIDIRGYKLLIKSPDTLQTNSVKNEAGLAFYKSLANEMPEKKLHALYKTIYKVSLIQYQSRQQKDTTTSKEDLKKLSFYKGGYSALLCRKMLDKPLEKNEYWFWMEFGGFIQLLDDIFDIYNDIKNGIRTIPSTSSSANEISKELKTDFQQLINKVKQLIPDRKNRIKFISEIFFLYLATYGIVEQFRRTQARKGNPSGFEQLTKKDSVYHTFSIINIFVVLKEIKVLAYLLKTIDR